LTPTADEQRARAFGRYGRPAQTINAAVTEKFVARLPEKAASW